MRHPLNKERLVEFIEAFGKSVTGEGSIYLTGGATALLHGWRDMTVDVDIKGEPEPDGFFESIAKLKDRLGINIELAAPDQFIPGLPGWKQRSPFIGRYGKLDFFHYDLYSQALAKLERGHPRDATDVNAMHCNGLIESKRLKELFEEIRHELIRFPSIEENAFADAVAEWCASHP